MSAQVCPIHCIVPPYLLKEIIENGTPVQREWASKTLQVTRQMVDQRKVVSEEPKPLITATPAAAPAARNRVVYDAHNTGNLPGTAMRREGDPAVEDVAVNEAYDGAGVTYDLFAQIYNRNSIDNQGMRIDSTVHYMKSYDNAFWDGNQMVYGDGDEDIVDVSQRLFNRFTISIDVIGHELTHGVTQYGSNLTYSGQSGALNESFSDVFGILVKQRHLNQTAGQSNWLIGEGLFTTNVNAKGIRSMSQPGTAYDDPLLGKDPQPAHMKDYVTTIEDNGGVHINSGIPNRAFYLAAVDIGGYAWEKVGQIWYTALAGRLPSNATFQAAADILYTVAGEIYGASSLEQQSVARGWAGVGITVNTGGGPGPQPNPNPGCLSSLLGIFRPRGS